jgi:ribosome-associated translation inhibitor RaiA
MPLRVSGRNINIGTALQRKITDRVEEATSKYFRGGYSGHATVGRDGSGSVPSAFCISIQAHTEAEGAPNALTVPNRRRSVSKSGCDATNAAQGSPGASWRLKS